MKTSSQIFTTVSASAAIRVCYRSFKNGRFFWSVTLLRNIFFQLKGCFHQAPFTGQKKNHGEAGINVSQMEVNKNTARRVSHGTADNDSSIMRCYAMTSSKVTLSIGKYLPVENA